MRRGARAHAAAGARVPRVARGGPRAAGLRPLPRRRASAPGDAGWPEQRSAARQDADAEVGRATTPTPSGHGRAADAPSAAGAAGARLSTSICRSASTRRASTCGRDPRRLRRRRRSSARRPTRSSADGQDWGFPPLAPRSRDARADGFADLRALRTAMRQLRAAAHRPRHGLHRLFWIPDGGAADDGAYVRLPAEELVRGGLRSRRTGAAPGGRRRGPRHRPRPVRRALARPPSCSEVCTLRPCARRPGATPPATCPAPMRWPASAPTTLPTFAGFWTGHDVTTESRRQPRPHHDARGRVAKAVRRIRRALGRRSPRDGPPPGMPGRDVRTPREALRRVRSVWLADEPGARAGPRTLRGPLARAARRRTCPATVDPLAPQLVAAPPGAARRSRTTRRPTPRARRPPSPPRCEAAAGEDPDALLTDDDLYLFNEGTPLRGCTRRLGAHPGARAPAPSRHLLRRLGPQRPSRLRDRRLQRLACPAPTPLRPRGTSGIWEGFVPRASGRASLYKYHDRHRATGVPPSTRPTPSPSRARCAPRTGVDGRATSTTTWGDGEWMAGRGRAATGVEAPDRRSTRCTSARGAACRRRATAASPTASWPRRSPTTSQRHGLHARRVAAGHGAPVLRLVGLPDHRLLRADAAATARPQDLMYLIDHLHQRGHRRHPRLGAVALPHRRARPRAASTAPTSTSTPTRARACTPTGTAPSSTTAATRCAASCSQRRCSGSTATTPTACGSTPSRRCSTSTTRAEAGEWMPNEYGGRENLEAIAFLRRPQRGGLPGASRTCRPTPRSRPPGRWSRARPTAAASASASSGTWAGCTTRCSTSPATRPPHATTTTSSPSAPVYAFRENFVLPLSHDEVVHGKGSLLAKMPGDEWQQLANLRLLFGYMYAQPGKKLLFMGAELAQPHEWNHDGSLDWELLDAPGHAGVAALVADLNAAYRDAAGAARATTATRPASSGSTPTTRRAASSASAPEARAAEEPRPRGLQLHAGGPRTATGSASPRGACGARCSTATRRCTAAAAGNLGGVDGGPVPAARAPVLARATVPRWVSCSSIRSPMPRDGPRARPAAPRGGAPGRGPGEARRFTVWAPAAAAGRGAAGRARTRRARARPGTRRPRATSTVVGAPSRCDRYRYRLDGGVARPDPASRSQPEGVHGPSAVVDPERSPGPTPAGRRPPPADLVLYELHVGTFTAGGHLRRRGPSASTRCATWASPPSSSCRSPSSPATATGATTACYPFAAQDALRRPRRPAAAVDAATAAASPCSSTSSTTTSAPRATTSPTSARTSPTATARRGATARQLRRRRAATRCARFFIENARSVDRGISTSTGCASTRSTRSRLDGACPFLEELDGRGRTSCRRTGPDGHRDRRERR